MGYFLYAHHQLWKTQEELPYGLGKLGKRFLEGLKLVAHLTHFMVATWYCKNVVITDLDFGVGEIRRNRGNKEGSDLGLTFGRWTLDAHNFIYFIFWKKKRFGHVLCLLTPQFPISNFKCQGGTHTSVFLLALVAMNLDPFHQIFPFPATVSPSLHHHHHHWLRLLPRFYLHCATRFCSGFSITFTFSF